MFSSAKADGEYELYSHLDLSRCIAFKPNQVLTVLPMRLWCNRLLIEACGYQTQSIFLKTNRSSSSS